MEFAIIYKHALNGLNGWADTVGPADGTFALARIRCTLIQSSISMGCPSRMWLVIAGASLSSVCITCGTTGLVHSRVSAAKCSQNMSHQIALLPKNPSHECANFTLVIKGSEYTALSACSSSMAWRDEQKDLLPFAQAIRISGCFRFPPKAMSNKPA